MKSKIWISLFLTILVLLSIWYGYNLTIGKNKKLEELLKQEYTTDELNSSEGVEKANERLEVLKKKISLKGLITKADMYFENLEYTNALNEYLKVYEQVPNDREINLKIGNIYYDLFKFDEAYKYYSNIKNYQNLDKSKAVLSLISGNYSGSGSYEEIAKEIDTLGLSKEDNFYYKNSMTCIEDFSKCRLNFEQYFEKNQTGTGEINESQKNIENIRNAFINYKNFQIDDLTYKAALVTGAFYQNGSYFISFETSKNILKENSNYKPILKIAAKSAYELGLYKESKDYLIEYNKIESDDAEASYFLARVYEKLNEKLLSVIHYNKALKIGYNDVNDIRRRLIFIYYALNDTNKMLETFKELIDSKDKNLTINDYNLAVYYHILNDDLENALKYSDLGKAKYSESELFYGYTGWIMLQNENIDEIKLKIVENNINKALEINDKSPMIVMVKGIYELKKENYDEAFIYFKKAISLDRNKEYSETTKYFLDKIPKK
ncbi:hypothetical protein HUU51_02320 [Candidatus Gracilibacteria bacterium]|nr:hypothetical protein [Candidatus Gracilibacteria bacterium]